MLVFKYVLMVSGIGLIAVAVAIVAYDLFLKMQYRHSVAAGVELPEPEPIRWKMTVVLFALAWAPMLIAAGIAVVPSGSAGVRVSETSGTLAGTLYPGVHFVTPVLEYVENFDTRDKLFTTGLAEDKVGGGHGKNALTVQAKEGLSLGLAITVRYRLDPKRLDYIQSHLPQPVETELVPPVVASAWREIAPNYTVREMFSAKREEVRTRAAGIITAKLGKDGVIVEEVMLRDIQLPPEYAKGLEDLLLKEQQNDQLSVQTEMQQKQVRISELEAEARKGTAGEAGRGRCTGEGHPGEERVGRDEVHASLERETDPTIKTGSGSTQGVDHQERGGCRRGEGDRQQG